MTDDPRPVTVTELVGVYDADGGMTGEVRYVVGHLLGRLECALCDITHGRVRRKQEFDELRARLCIPFSVVHRNERRADVAAATEGALPCLVAVTGGGLVIVLDKAALQACGGDVAEFERRLRGVLTARGLELGASE